MTDSNLTTGSICWTDLTVINAESLRDFYKEVVGWESVPVEMGAYHDFGMKPVESDQHVAGICHARGINAELPPQWLIYIVVADLDLSVQRCESLGGTVLHRRGGHDGLLAVIKDPADAVVALYQPSEANETG